MAWCMLGWGVVSWVCKRIWGCEAVSGVVVEIDMMGVALVVVMPCGVYSFVLTVNIGWLWVLLGSKGMGRVVVGENVVGVWVVV